MPARTLYVGDSELVVREVGPEGAPPILLIHGLGGSSLAEWYQVGPLLARRRRVIMVDHRSHGLAPKARSRYEIDDLADDIAGVLGQIGVGALPVVGYSMGGAIAQALAHRHPSRVTAIGLIATTSHHPEPARTLRLAAAVLTRAWERLTGLGVPEVRSGYLLATGAVEEGHARWLWEETHRRDVDAGAEATMAMVRFDSREYLGRIEVPALVVIPTRDQLLPPAWQYRMAALLRTPTVVELAGARHEVAWTHPERLAEALGAFLPLGE